MSSSESRIREKKRVRVALIGAIGIGEPPSNGEEVKNQHILAYLSQGYLVDVVDTKHWRSRPWIMAEVLWSSLLGRQQTTILSASSASVHTLLKALRWFKRAKGRIIYLVIGGYVQIGVGSGRYRPGTYSGLKAIVMEGESMRQSMRSLGIDSQLFVMPNFKTIRKTYGDSSKYSVPKKLFLFLGRITESKGTLLVFKALEHPLLKERISEFSVDFYGKIEEGHRADFESGLEKHLNCHYAGYIDVTHDGERSYEKLSAYHAMLFPTFWMGEGFPGVVIDCFVAGVPVIASDWNMNREVIQNDITGRIIPPEDPAALAEAMASVLDDRETWGRMSVSCHAKAFELDTETVLTRDFAPLL